MKLKPLPDYGDLMTVLEFYNACQCVAFNDYDGHGCLATQTEASDVRIYPSQLFDGTFIVDANPVNGATTIRHNGKTFTHVVWFNK